MIKTTISGNIFTFCLILYSVEKYYMFYLLSLIRPHLGKTRAMHTQNTNKSYLHSTYAYFLHIFLFNSNKRVLTGSASSFSDRPSSTSRVLGYPLALIEANRRSPPCSRGVGHVWERGLPRRTPGGGGRAAGTTAIVPIQSVKAER